MKKLIHVRFYANMRTITGQSNLDVDYSGANTLRKLIARLVENYPDMQYNVLDEHENLRQDVPIFVNGRNPRLTNAGINIALEPDDVISLFSPISSGRMNVEVMRSPEDGEEEQIR
jgi:MoaD family protein